MDTMTGDPTTGSEVTFDLADGDVRRFNQALHDLSDDASDAFWRVTNPGGRHAIAAGADTPVRVRIEGHVGYYCAGMNKQADIEITGNAGVGVAENMMSGCVRVRGDVSQAAGATGRGGLLITDGNAGARCGISMKGIDIVVRGSIGQRSAFMAQTGTLLVLGDAGEALGDSIYEARLYVAGSVKSLGADCIEKDVRDEHRAEIAGLLERAQMTADAGAFRRFGSARALYNFEIDNMATY